MGKFVYIYLVYFFVFNYFGGILDLLEWFFKIVVFSWVLWMLNDFFDFFVFFMLFCISFVLIVFGVIGYRRRDLVEG